jgi:hypothetical protein
MFASAGDRGELLLWRPAAAGTAAPGVGGEGATLPWADTHAAPPTHPPAPTTHLHTALLYSLQPAPCTPPSRPASPSLPLPVAPAPPAAAPAPAAPPSDPAAAPAASVPTWRQAGSLRGHCDDVLDVSWSPDGSALASGGVENAVFVWDVEGRKSLVRGRREGALGKRARWGRDRGGQSRLLG